MFYYHRQVSQQEYDECNISSGSKAVMMLNCSNPTLPKRFTLIFEMFQAIPNVPEFVYGGKYLYICKTLSKLSILNSL